jgi:hypothetical protein
VSWKVCLTAQPCKTRSGGRRRVADSKQPDPALVEPEGHGRVPQAVRGARNAPRVGAGASTLLSRRHAAAALNESLQMQPPLYGLGVNTELPRPKAVRSPRSPGRGPALQQPRSPMSSPKRDPTFEQRVAHRQPMPGLNIAGSDWTREVQGRAAHEGWHGQNGLSETPGASHARQPEARAASMRSPAIHSSMHNPLFTPDHSWRGVLQSHTQWSTPISSGQADALGSDREVASLTLHLVLLCCFCPVCICLP